MRKATVVAKTLISEVRILQDGEQRHASLLAERVSGEPPPTMPVDFAAELAQLRSLVAELQREREELRAVTCCHTTRAGSPTQVNSVVVNTSIRFDGTTQVLMETLVDGGSAVASHCTPCSSGEGSAKRLTTAASKEKEGSQFARDSSGQ